MKPVKNIPASLFVLVGFVALVSLLHAQSIATLTQSGTASMTTTDVSAMSDLEVEVKAIEMTTPLPVSSVPVDGNFYSTQHLPGTANEWPPLPENIFGLSAWPLGDGFYLLDDTNVDYVALAAAAAAAQPKTSLVSKSGSLKPMFSLISGSGGTPVYLTNLVSMFTNGNVTVTFSIAGGTNGFAYDIYTTTNLANWPVYSTWTWLGQGYTTNNYTFNNQPFDNAFYILAIPRQTMVVAWGWNSAGELDVPAGLTNAIDVAGGDNKFSLALKADGTVVAWGDSTYGETNVPAGLTNVTALAAGQDHAVALKADGTVVEWGCYFAGVTNYVAVGSTPAYSNFVAVAAGAGHDLGLRADGTVVTWGLTNDIANYVPTNLPGVKAIACGLTHNAALLTNGTVTVWGWNGAAFGWNITNVPVGLSNVIAIAAGDYHTLALKADGTVSAWGAGSTNTGGQTYENFGQSIVPAGLSNVVAVAGGGGFSLALKADGTMVAWGDDTFGQINVPAGLNGVKAIAGGGFQVLAVRSGSLTPIILQEPGDQYSPTGGTVTFSSLGAGLYGVTYQWQFNGVNIAGATNATLTLTNMQTANVGSYQVIISNSFGSVISIAATFTIIPPPQINSITPALGIDWIANYPISPPLANYTNIPLSVTTATYAGQSSGFPLSYQWSLNGTNIAYAATGPQYMLSLYSSWISAAPLEGAYTLAVANAAGSTNVGTWNIRVLVPGMTAAWGDDTYGECDRPVTLTNVAALAAGVYCSAAMQDNGTLIQWGDFAPDDFQTPAAPTPMGSPPASSNIVAVAAGIAHAVALKTDGTVMQWGLAGATGLQNFPTNLAGVKAVSAGFERSLALLTNGTIVDWGYFAPIFNLNQRVPGDLTNVTAISCGAYHNLALRSDGTVESWGYNTIWGETNVPAGLSNVVAVAGGGRHSLALKADGTVAAWGDNTYGQCNVPAGLSNVMAIAAGYLHSVALLNNGTVVSWGDNTYTETNVPGALMQIKLIAASGYHSLAAMFSPTVQYPVDVTKDLLLIYNSNSTDSSNVCAYYLANRPLVANANVLSVACDTNELTSSNSCDAQIVAPVLNWLTNNPTKHPEYIVLFYGIPTRLTNSPAPYGNYGSISFHLQQSYPGWQPFVNNINAGSAADCRAYVDKLAYIGTNYSPGKLIISAGSYGNTNYAIDNVNIGFCSDSSVANATNGLAAASVASSAIRYLAGCESGGSLPHITSATNVAGYISWGEHSSMGDYYSTNRVVKWSGNSSWWIIETIESFNGQVVQYSPQGNFVQWFSSIAFGGANYSNTPVGAVTHTEEPGSAGSCENSSIYFGLWATGKNFAICAWNSRQTPYFQAVGDPLITK